MYYFLLLYVPWRIHWYNFQQPSLCTRQYYFFIGSQRLNNEFCSDLELEAATQSTYCFTKQKNQHKGDVIAHATSGDMLCCPVKATVRQCLLDRKERQTRNKLYDGTDIVPS